MPSAVVRTVITACLISDRGTVVNRVITAGLIIQRGTAVK